MTTQKYQLSYVCVCVCETINFQYEFIHPFCDFESRRKKKHNFDGVLDQILFQCTVWILSLFMEYNTYTIVQCIEIFETASESNEATATFDACAIRE